MSVTPHRASLSHTATVAICGNPNCGKTTIFNGITGLRQKVANYPGVTVEKVTGHFQVPSYPDLKLTLVDIPGSYSLAALSPDEYIAARAMFGGFDGEARPDLIICVIDATNLERGLYFLFQVLQIGQPVVVALNMIDVVLRRGQRIHANKLSRLLGGIPVVPVVGNRGTGINKLKKAVAETLESPGSAKRDWYDPLTEEVLTELMAISDEGNHTKAEYLRILFDKGGPAEREFLRGEYGRKRAVLDIGRKRLTDHFGSLSAAETAPLTSKAADLCHQVLTVKPVRRRSAAERADRVLLHPLFGLVILVLVVTLIFQSIFTLAQPLMNLIDSLFTDLATQVDLVMTEGPLQSLLVDGVIGGVGSVLIFIPQIVILFLFVAILEDSGYMPRAAFLVDRIFRWCGLSGKSFIPMLSSFACAVPGIMATRTIENRKLRFLTIMVAPLMSCSARLPVYTIMIVAFIPYRSYLGLFNSQGLVLASMYLLGILVAAIVSIILSKTVLRPEPGSFLMEMPAYRIPTPRSVFLRVFNGVWLFVLRAGTIILAIMVLIWALSYYPRSEQIAHDFESSRRSMAETHMTQLASLEERLSVIAADQSESKRAAIENLEQRVSTATSEPELAAIQAEYLAGVPGDSILVWLIVQQKRVTLSYERELLALSNEQAGASLRNSYFGRIGRHVEPLFGPLGWDWRITMAALASFPAREVIVATLGTIFNLGSEVDEASSSLIDKMRQATWEEGPRMGEPLFTPAVALSIMVFFALCCQCGATLVVIYKETNGWLYPLASFVYMTVLAYLAAIVVYQVFSGLGA